ncbi:hypothetical protein C882_2652 [Caenispirillum salinarum AK4]|uniref:Lipoprotein n=1 Tax=Caenispirillum salinarum AK4 TaxID=1238182 RepID=K9HQM1_9PROT|nr:hypothetical protein [Caenispirillum salinarum]EKV32573.1 hypothetical protein C882_2652 [Caenispirillum salinarum AK4]
MRRLIAPAAACALALGMAACENTIEDDFGARPGANYDTEFGVPAPTPVPDEPDVLDQDSPDYEPLALPEGDR